MAEHKMVTVYFATRDDFCRYMSLQLVGQITAGIYEFYAEDELNGNKTRRLFLTPETELTARICRLANCMANEWEQKGWATWKEKQDG